MKPLVFFDSCIFFSQSLRDISLQLAVDEHYQAKWSDLVEEEFVRNVEAKIPGTKGKLSRTVSLMRSAVPDYLAVATPRTLKEVAETRTDKKDVPILAAALDAGANSLVTANFKHFDREFAQQRRLSVVSPDVFFLEVIRKNPTSVLKSFQTVVLRNKKPARTIEDYCEALVRAQVPKTAKALIALASN